MAAANSQGIVFSIQAKIEGWQSQIKAIQDALKNIHAGSSLSKDLTKELKQVESLVNNLGKNVNQRLTSDSAITGFVDKLKSVDEIFINIGQHLSGVSFKDLDPSYITNNFKDLLSEIQKAEDELSSGMTNSFQRVISESTHLQKAFNKLQIDPSKMGAEELKKVLETKHSNLVKEIEKANTEIDNMRANAKALENTMKDLSNTKIMQVKDTKVEARNIMGDTSKLGSTQVNVEQLQELARKVETAINDGDIKLAEKIKEKKAEIDVLLKDLVSAKSLAEARTKIQELQNLFISVRSTKEFDGIFKTKEISDEALTKWVPNADAVKAKLDEIKATLETYQIDPKLLRGFDIKELLTNGNFDKLADEIHKALTKAQNVAVDDIKGLEDKIKELRRLAQNEQNDVMSKAATRANIEKGLGGWEKIIQQVQEENKTLKQEVEALKKQLEQRATAAIKGTGGSITARGSAGLQESTAQAKAYEAQLGRVKSAEQALGKLQGVVQRWFSIYAVIRMVSNAVRSMISTIKELDKTITNIAIVTDMNQDDLWKQMPKYTQMARQYAASISGVYEVSQLYYQQGLEMADVMQLTEATLKMARISGLGYADATDYMTNAVRSFKMEMSEATTVVDVYSAVAASSATSVTELATAMSKTASSAQAVGASFQNTTAMMAVMIEATRESPENIGSALKSIISRYGELKENITGVDADGEAYSLNKVDKALQSVGISIHDVNGEFRNFDDVIQELADSWDTIDKNTQRYIATVMAGNRQQSRFLALVSSGERLKELSEEAANSEDASQLQFLKTLDSIEAKTQQLQTSIQSLYTSSGLEEVYKNILDISNAILTSLDNISNNQGLVGVVTKIASSFGTLATLIITLFNTIKLKFSLMQTEMTAKQQEENAKRFADDKLRLAQEEEDIDKKKILWQEYLAAKEQATEASNNRIRNSNLKATTGFQKAGIIASVAGLTFSTAAASMDINTQRQEKALLTGLGSVLSGAGTGFMMGGGIGAIVGILTGLPGIIEAIGMSTESVADKITRLENSVTEANNERIKSKDELKTLDDYKKKYDELSKSQYESNESKQEFIDLQNEIAEKYPELISKMDEEGNYTVNLAEGYERLAAAKREAYKEDLITAMSTSISSLNDIDYVLKNVYGQELKTNKRDILDWIGEDTEQLLRLDYHENQSQEARKIFSGKNGTFTIQDLFNNIIQDNLTYRSKFTNDLTGTFKGKLYNQITSEGIDILSQLYDDFIEGMTSNKDLATVQGELIASKKWGQYYAELINSFDANIYKELQARYQVPDHQKQLINNRLNSYTSEYINLIADSADAVFGTESSVLDKRFVKEQLSTEWNDQQDKLMQRQQNGEEIDWTTELENFYKSHEEFWYNMQVESEVLSGITSEAEEFYKNLGQYSKQDIEKLFPDWETNEIQGQRKTFFDSIWQQDYETIVKGYTDWLDSISDQEFDIHKYSDVFGPEFLSNIQEKYSEILSSNLSSTSKQSQIDILNKIYDTAASESLSVTERNSILTTLHGADLFSITGIYDVITAIEELDLGENGDIITEALNQLSREITINLTTEVSNLLNSYSAQIESFTKDLSNASKGLDFKSAAELADKLGLNLSDFNQIGDKFYLKDLTQLQDYYIQEDEKYQQALRDSIEQKKELYSNTIELPDPLTEIEYFDLEAYINSENEEYRKQLYDYWAEEIQAISPTWTFENLEKYRNNRAAYIRNNWINEEDFKLSREYITDETHTKEFNIEEIIKQNQYNLELIEEELKNNWEEELSDLNIDSSKMLTDIASYIDNRDFSITLAEYTANESYKLLDSVIDAETKAVQYLMASTQLANGDITGFLTTVLGNVQNKDVIADIVTSEAEWIGKSEEEIVAEIERRYQAQAPNRDALINQIQSGNIENLPEELQDYAKLIYDTYSKLSSNIFSTVTNALEKEEDAVLNVNELNAAKLIESGLVKESDIYDISDNGKVLKTDMVIIPYEQLKNMTDEEFNTFLDSLSDNYADRVKAIGARMARGRIDISADFENVNKDVKNISYEDITQLWHDLGLLTEDNDTQEHINELMKQWGLQYDGLGHIVGDVTLIDQEIANLLLKYTNGAITQEEYNREKAKLDQVKEEIANSVDQQKGEALSSIIENYAKVTPEQYSQLMQAFADISTEAKDALESVFTINTDGTRTFDLTKFLSLVKDDIIPISDAVNEIISESIEEQIDSIRNSISDATKLVTTGTTSEAEMQKWIDKFKAVGIDTTNAFNYDELISAWTLDPNILKQYADAQVQALGLSGKEAQQFLFDQTTKVLAQAVDISGYLSAEDQSETSIATQQLYSQLENWAESKGKEIDVNAWVSDIKTGGDAAVEKAQEIAADAGQTLTQAEIEAIYSPITTRLTNFASQLEGLTKGQYVAEGEFKEILRKANMIDENGLVTNVENIVDAYDVIIRQLKEESGSTAAAINAIEAKKLTALEQDDIDAIAAMGDAMGMTYDALGQILGKEGLDLEQWLKTHSNQYQKIGGGKIRLTNFTAFAEDRGWQPGSEEYTKAFKAYNDALIEYDHQIQQTIIDEVSQLENANITSKLNFTNMEMLFGDGLLNILSEYGGVLKDGVLSFTETANIAKIFSEIVKLIENTEDETLQLSKSEIANLKDAVTNMLSNVVSLVNTGLEGKLTNAQFNDLSSYATQNGIGTLDYTETYEGIQLTEESFAELYAHLAKVDKKLAKTLLPNITKMSKQYRTLGDVLKAYQKATEGASEAQKQVMKDLASSMLRNPENYNLMGSELPAEWQIGENYYGSLSKGFQVIQSMAKDGKLSLSDFYAFMQSIINNTENMADRQQALDWLQQAPDHFFDDNGTPMIDVKAMGLSSMGQELYRMMTEAYANIQKAGQLEQRIFDELFYGSEALENAEVVEKGKVNIQKIKEIIESKTKQGDNIKLLLDSIKIGNQSLYDMLDSSEFSEGFSADLRDKLITLLSETNFEFENFDEQATDLFNQLGLKGSIEFDSSTGEIKFIYDSSATETSLIYKDGNTEFANYDEWVEWQLLKDQKNFKEKTIGSGENARAIGATYETETGVKITVKITDGQVSYSFDVEGVGTVQCDTQEQLDAAIAQLITANLSDDQSNNEQQYYTVNKDGVIVKVNIKTGEVELDEDASDEERDLASKVTDAAQNYVEQAAETAEKELEAQITPMKNAIAAAFSEDSVKTTLSDAFTEGMKNAFSGGEGGATAIPIDEITVQPETIKVDTSVASIVSAEGEAVDTLTVEGLKGIIESYDDSLSNKEELLNELIAYITQYDDQADKSQLVNDLTAIITSYIDNGSPDSLVDSLIAYVLDYINMGNPESLVESLNATVLDYYNNGDPNLLVDALTATIGTYTDIEDPNILVSALSALITNYSNADGSDPETLVNALTAMIGWYTNDETANPDELVAGLNALIANYSNGEDDPNNLVSALVAQISEYKNGKNVKIPTLEDLTQVINAINTTGADAALEVWRQEQEAKTLNITVNASTGSKRSYETTQEFENAVEANAVLIESDEEHFTFKVAADAIVDFSQVILPEGWQYNGEDQTLTTTSQWYIPVELRLENSSSGMIMEDADVDFDSKEIDVTAKATELDTSAIQEEEVDITDLIPEQKIDLDTSDANSKIDEINERIAEQEIKPADVNSTAAHAKINEIDAAAKQSVTKTVYVKEVDVGSAAHGRPALSYGNVALAAGRKTLMGELGPEIYVSNGHYYIAGEVGAEFVDLPEDAIVFNHMQTRQLLQNGYTNHGKAVISERKAIGAAHDAGNLNIDTNKKTKVSFWDTVGGLIDKAIQEGEKLVQTTTQVTNKQEEQANATEKVKTAEEKKADAEKNVAKAQLDGMKRTEQMMNAANNAGKQIEDLSHEIKANANLSREEIKAKEEQLAKLLQSDAGVLYQNNGGAYSEEQIKAVQDLITKADTVVDQQKEVIQEQKALVQEQQETTQEEKKVIKKQQSVITDPNRIHTGYQRRQGANGSNATSVSDGYYKSKDNSSVAYSTLRVGADQYFAKTIAQIKAASGTDTKEIEEYAKQVQSVISKLLEVGFEAIDLDSSEFEKLDAALKAEMKEYILRADASYREFVRTYAEAGNMTISEANEAYFEAWQKDLDNEGRSIASREAARSLTFFSGGAIAGSAEDWTTLLGDYTSVMDLVDEQIIEWNEDLEQFVVTSIEKLQEWDTNLDVTAFQDIINDSMRAASQAMTDLLEKAESGSITYEEFNNLNEYLNYSNLSEISRDMLTKTSEGLIVSYKTLTELYAEAIEKNLDKETTNAIRKLVKTRMKSLTDAISAGANGSMGFESIDILQSFFDDFDEDVAVEFTETINGIKLSHNTLAHFYALLKQTDALAAQLTLKNLNQSLKETSMDYQTMSSTLNHIKDLHDQINNANEQTSDAKIKQYQEELELAQDILAVRATSEDDSYDFLNKELPAGMNNPLTYVQNWADAWKEVSQAAGEDGSGIIDFKKFYNMAAEVNNMAGVLGDSLDFFGFKLDGGLDNLNELITKAANSLGSSVDGSQFGVSLSKMGIDLESGMDSYAGSADSAMHAMAEANIKVLDGLIAMFEMIVAMEEFEGVDLDLDGLLDFEEIFDVSGLDPDQWKEATKYTDKYIEGAKKWLEHIDASDELKAFAQKVKINNVSMYEIVSDATDGLYNLAGMTQEQVQVALSAFYDALKNGDYDEDDIYTTLIEQFQGKLGNMTVQLGDDMIVEFNYGAKVNINADGKFEAAGQTFDDPEQAMQASIAAKVGAKDIIVDAETGKATGTLTLGKAEFKVEVADNVATYNGYTSLDDAIQAEYDKSGSTIGLEKWKIQQEIEIIPVVSSSLKESDLELDQNQINAAIGKSFEKISKEWEDAQKTEEGTLQFEATYGIQLNENTTEEDWARFKELAGIETKNVELNVSINVVNSDNILEQLLGANGGNVGVDANPEQAKEKAEELQSDINSMTSSITIEAVDNASSIISSIQDSLNDLERTYTATIETEDKTDTSAGGDSSAKGTISGTAMAGGTKTLMGELGPELYVSNGRYHLAGQSGAEFVNLPDDAIVFNHLQTEKLLSTGAAGRGKPITNEFNAVAMARGSGPAAASAKQILATLKQMRAMWQSIASMSVQELAGMGGSETNKSKSSSWLAQVERWYDLLQKIARLEKEINYQEALRNKLESDRVPNGTEYYKTQVQSLNNLQQQALAHKELSEEQKDYFEQRRKELNERKSPFANFYTFDEDGQLKYKEGAFDKLADIVQQDEWGKPKYTPQQQYQIMVDYGFEEYMKYDSSGNLIDTSEEGWETQAVQAVWERMEAEQQEMQSLYDSYTDEEIKYLDSISEGNKILQQIVDNQLDLENQVIEAIENREQAIIDQMSEERDALSKSTGEYISGLQDALNKERKMYEKNNSATELQTLQRKLGILQRSGGSAAEITELQQAITDKQKDIYFDAQSDQINAIQEASDLQLEKMQTQIDIMTETLEFQKENGLLWVEANDILTGTAASITEFITSHMPDWQSKSSLDQEETQKTIMNSAEQWVGYRDAIIADSDTNANLVKEAMQQGFEEVTLAIYNPEDLEAAAQRKEEVKAAEEERKRQEKATAEQQKKIEAENSLYDWYNKFMHISRSEWDAGRANGTYSDEWLEQHYGKKGEATGYYDPRYSQYGAYGNQAYRYGIVSTSNNLEYDRINAEIWRLQTEMSEYASTPYGIQQRQRTQEQINDLIRYRDSLMGYSDGGLVDYTGLAIVHGTKTEPEAFLNSEEVKTWKENVLNVQKIWERMRQEQLELEQLRQAFQDNSMLYLTNANSNSDSGIIIEHAEVNMNVEKIADDYDARRAADTAMDEMVRLARKQNNRIGR